ncbi:hypothetical protein B296_00030545 [Ensete ventricosum]|uniref:Uncharacterized protein n=1 Tax=Ensete ventricosum TaxID=4639 RepID=A0A426ZAV1_ENSVE|nr:hypothetical protein B296_00030545 [Ensete ventricosum]
MLHWVGATIIRFQRQEAEVLYDGSILNFLDKGRATKGALAMFVLHPDSLVDVVSSLVHQTQGLVRLRGDRGRSSTGWVAGGYPSGDNIVLAWGREATLLVIALSLPGAGRLPGAVSLALDELWDVGHNCLKHSRYGLDLVGKPLKSLRSHHQDPEIKCGYHLAVADEGCDSGYNFLEEEARGVVEEEVTIAAEGREEQRWPEEEAAEGEGSGDCNCCGRKGGKEDLAVGSRGDWRRGQRRLQLLRQERRKGRFSCRKQRRLEERAAAMADSWQRRQAVGRRRRRRTTTALAGVAGRRWREQQ